MLPAYRICIGLYFACILTVSCSDVWDTSVVDCILLVSCLYRVGYFVSQCHATFMCEDTFVFAPRVLYLDRIRWFPDSRTGIHPEYIRIHQNTSGYCIHRKPPLTQQARVHCRQTGRDNDKEAQRHKR